MASKVDTKTAATKPEVATESHDSNVATAHSFDTETEAANNAAPTCGKKNKATPNAGTVVSVRMSDDEMKMLTHLCENIAPGVMLLPRQAVAASVKRYYMDMIEKDKHGGEEGRAEAA